VCGTATNSIDSDRSSYTSTYWEPVQDVPSEPPVVRPGGRSLGRLGHAVHALLYGGEELETEANVSVLVPANGFGDLFGSLGEDDVSKAHRPAKSRGMRARASAHFACVRLGGSPIDLPAPRLLPARIRRPLHTIDELSSQPKPISGIEF
jgi:hypothetical protein